MEGRGRVWRGEGRKGREGREGQGGKGRTGREREKEGSEREGKQVHTQEFEQRQSLFHTMVVKHHGQRTDEKVESSA